MAKYFIDVVQDSHRTRLGIPVKTKNALSRTNTPPAGPPFGFEFHGRLVPAYIRVLLPIRLNRPAAPTRGRKRSLP